MSISVVSLSSIDDSFVYMISRKNSLRELEQSVKKNGLIEPPVLLKKGDSFAIISGHNRIKVLKTLGVQECAAEIRDAFNHEEFLRIVLRKMYYKTISLAGRMKSYSILSDAGLDSQSDSGLKLSLQIPVETSKSFIETFLSSDELIYDYCNEKDAPIRIIEQILGADAEFAKAINALMRGNISLSSLRNILELYDDIRRNENMRLLLNSRLENIDADMTDPELSEILRSIRYPQIEEYSKKISLIAETFKKVGADLSFPVYEEGQPVKVSVVIKRNGGGAYLKTLKKLTEIGAEEIVKLM